jgi:hypothetical protein
MRRLSKGEKMVAVQEGYAEQHQKKSSVFSMHEDVVVLARSHSARAIQCLAALLDNTRIDSRSRVKAAEILLERAWGKAPASLSIVGAQIQQYSDLQLEEMAAEILERRRLKAASIEASTALESKLGDLTPEQLEEAQSADDDD